MATGLFCAGALLALGGCGSEAPLPDVAKANCFDPLDLDANHDGNVTREEAISYYTEEFKWFDQNNSGKIKLDDFVSTAEVKALIDTNKDGIATQEEYVAYWSAHPCKCGQYR